MLRGCFFSSLIGSRWNLDSDEKLDFEKMFNQIIKHCQGSCIGKTKQVIIITDNWDDDIVSFWQKNIENIKENGIKIEVNLLVGDNINSYEL